MMKAGLVVLLVSLLQFDSIAQSFAENDSSKIRIHCSPSISRSWAPMYIVNEVEYQRRKIKKINPDNIEKISVVKGPEATALYGVRGEYGVILIELKKKPSRRRR